MRFGRCPGVRDDKIFPGGRKQLEEEGVKARGKRPNKSICAQTMKKTNAPLQPYKGENKAMEKRRTEIQRKKETKKGKKKAKKKKGASVAEEQKGVTPNASTPREKKKMKSDL